MVYTDNNIIITPPVSGTYEMVATMDIYYYGINVVIYDTSRLSWKKTYEFADDGYGMVTRTITLEAGKYYYFEVYGDTGTGFYWLETGLKFTLVA